MLFPEKLDDLKNKLPSQYRDNVVDYKTLKTGIDEVVERLNKTGIYDLQTHSHLIMENGMKTNIDNHIRETFKKSKVVIEDNTLTEIFDDDNIIASVEENKPNSHNNPSDLPSKLKENELKDTSSIDSIYEKDIHYNFKEDLEEELKKSQVKLVKFINNAKDKEEIIKGLSLKYYQIFYALKEIDNEDGKKQIRSSLIVSMSKVTPDDLDVQKFLDEITGQNSELFEHEGENPSENPHHDEEVEEEKIDLAHLEMIRQSLKGPESSNDISNMVQSPADATPLNSRKQSDNLAIQNDIDVLRLSHSPVECKLNEHMLGRNQRQDSNDSNFSLAKNSSASSLTSHSSDDSDQDMESDEMFDFQDDDEVDIILPSSSNENIPKDKEIEPDPIAVKGDSAEMIQKRASIIQKRLSEYNVDDGISKEKFMSLFNNKKIYAFRRHSSHSCYEGKLSVSSSMQSIQSIPEFDQPGSFYSVESSRSSILGVHNYWEIPIYSYYSYSVIPDDQRISDAVHTEEPETFELELETNETAGASSNPEEIKIVSLMSRQSSYASSNNTNSPEVKSCRFNIEPTKSESPLVDHPHSSSFNAKNPSSATITFTEPIPISKLKKRNSFTNFFKKSKSLNDNLYLEGQSASNKASSLGRSVSINNIDDSNGIYVRKTRSHSFSYRFKNPFKKLSSRRNSRASIGSNNSLSRVIEIEQIHEIDREMSMRQSSNNKEKRVEILLESDTTFLNKMVTIFKNLTNFERDCRNLFETNVNITKKLLKEVSAPGKEDTYPWRNINRLYRETDVWTHNGKVNTWEQATDKLELFKTKAEKFTKKFKMEDSMTVFNQFLKLNQDAITLKQFYEINQTAIYMVLKDHDKDTKLNACEGLPCFINTDFFSDNACKRFTYDITQGLLSIIPDPDKYSCPICQELAYKPIRLNCNHLFCLKCLIRAQKKNLDNCPVCRAKDAVKNATSKNLDKKLLNTLTSDFPREIRARKKQLKEITQQQEIEDAKELAKQPFSFKESEEEENCIIM